MATKTPETPEIRGDTAGIGFWLWDEWNNLKVDHIVIAIFVIGIVGLLLETMLIALARRYTYTEE